MYVCNCHPFSDKKVKEIFEEEAGQRHSVSEIYRRCSGADHPNCAKCIPFLKSMVKEHNDGIKPAPRAKP